MRPVTVEFTVTADLDERGYLACTWVCARCGESFDPRAVRAHVVAHAHEEIGLATASHNQGDPE